MKKRTIKLLSVFLTICLAFSVFSLTACGRDLDDVEKSLVGTWDGNYGFTYTLNDDGTVTALNGDEGTFKHSGSGETDAGIKYEIIVFEGDISIANSGPYYLAEDVPGWLYTDKQCRNANGALRLEGAEIPKPRR